MQRVRGGGEVPPLCAKRTPRFPAPPPLAAAAAAATTAKSHGLECQPAHGRLALWRNKCKWFNIMNGGVGV